MSLRNRFGAFFFALTFVTACAYSFAEQSTTDSACVPPDAPPPVIKSFLIEHVANVAAINSTFPPKLPGVVFAAILSGEKEPLSRITYDQETGILRNTLYLADPNSVLPIDPATFDIVGATFGFLDVQVDTVYTSCQPSPTVLVVGVVLDGVDIFLPPAGAPYAFSFAYTTDTTVMRPFRDIVSDTVGLGLLYQTDAPGSITFGSSLPQTIRATRAGRAPR
jgi:hypothetical protein